MRAHPARAARVLESLPADEAGALFAQAPARIVAPVLAEMPPRAAAQAITGLDDARVLELLAAMATASAVGVLRHLEPARRRPLVAGLPTAAALASVLLLGHAEDTLGACADPDVVALPAETTAGDALERLRGSASAHAQVVVVDGQRRVLGLVALAVLLRAPAGIRLASLVQRGSGSTIAAATPLGAAAAHPGWSQSSTLAVIGADERLVGLLTHDALRRALARREPSEAPQAAQGGLGAVVALGYWRALAGLLGGALGALPRIAPLAGDEGDGR
jgi:magnesium transporter